MFSHFIVWSSWTWSRDGSLGGARRNSSRKFRLLEPDFIIRCDRCVFVANVSQKWDHEGEWPKPLWLAVLRCDSSRLIGPGAARPKRGYCQVCFRGCGNGVFVLQERELISECDERGLYHSLEAARLAQSSSGVLARSGRWHTRAVTAHVLIRTSKRAWD